MIRTGEICMTLLLNYLKNETSKDNSISSNSEFKDKASKLSRISSTFTNYGGVLTKLSQIISYGEGKYNSDVFSDCKPKNSKDTIKYLTNILIDKNDILEFDRTIYKSGSIGQVHKGKIIKEDKDEEHKENITRKRKAEGGKRKKNKSIRKNNIRKRKTNKRRQSKRNGK